MNEQKLIQLICESERYGMITAAGQAKLMWWIIYGIPRKLRLRAKESEEKD